MKATLGTMPHSQDDWAFEIKWDGYRTLAHIGGSRLRLQSSNSLDVTAKYPELVDFPAHVNAQNAILDGELVVLNSAGRPSFELMQQHATDVAFYVFDVLHIDGHDTIGLAYESRRALLENLVEPGSHWMVPAFRIGAGTELLQATADMQLEGVMAKRLGSPYLVGRRSTSWVKLKNRRTVEVAIGGYDLGSGARAASFGALLVGSPAADGALVFAGSVGTGFTQQTLDSLGARLKELRISESPFSTQIPASYRKGAFWVSPTLRAKLEIAEFTNEGYVRHASFISLA